MLFIHSLYYQKCNIQFLFLSVDLTKWQQKIEEERDQEVEGEVETEVGVQVEEAASVLPQVHQRYKDGILTVGTIGHPNVGKSSLINALMGKKVVLLTISCIHWEIVVYRYEEGILSECCRFVFFFTGGKCKQDSRTHQAFSDYLPYQECEAV